MPRVYSGIDNLTRARALLRRSRTLPAATTVPPRALLIWQERPDLREAFDLGNRKGREGLVCWYLRHGYGELGLRYESSDDHLASLLSTRIERLPQHSFAPVTWLMRLCADRCPSLKTARLRDPAKQDALVSWFYAHGLMEANLGGFLRPEQALQLLTSENGTPRIFHCVWNSSPDLTAHFSGPTDPHFHAWCANEGGRRFPILSHPLIKLAAPPARKPFRAKPFGVNLFGHANARSGVSEDVRMAVRVLETAGIPFSLHNVSPGTTMPEEDDYASCQTVDLPYAINLFCMPAATTPQAALQLGRSVLSEHWNIGFWPWELPEVPRFWHHAYDFVDEVWASTRFIYEAISRSAPVPVRFMPFAVVAEESDGLSRSDFKLPEDAFLFGFAFDGLSGFARKAPLLALRAFQKAFPRESEPSSEPVALVIKGMRAKDDPAWRQLQAEIDDDPRIHLVTNSLSRGSLLDLWRSLDAFVSVHRSEGFGRILAEMMLLGRPVVATAHSGNMDFTRHDTAALVPCHLTPIKSGEYPFGTGQLWAEPDVTAAARSMVRLKQEPEWTKMLSQAGRATIAAQYAPDVIAALWKPALQKIYSNR